MNHIQDSLTGNKIEHSYSERKIHLDLLQEAEEQEAEKENSDAVVTVEANKINKDYDDMISLMEEDQKTLEYQETMKVDVKNISKIYKMETNIWSYW